MARAVYYLDTGATEQSCTFGPKHCNYNSSDGITYYWANIREKFLHAIVEVRNSNHVVCFSC